MFAPALEVDEGERYSILVRREKLPRNLLNDEGSTFASASKIFSHEGNAQPLFFRCSNHTTDR